MASLVISFSRRILLYGVRYGDANKVTNQPTNWNKFLLEEPILGWMFIKIPTLIEPKCSLTSSLEPVTGRNSELYDRAFI
jgi:hypothetical protein